MVELNSRSRNRSWSRLHFLVRLLGLIGLLAVIAGVVVAYVIADSLSFWCWPWNWPGRVISAVWGLITDPSTSLYGIIAGSLLLGGSIAVLLALFVEAIVVLFQVAGRRSAFGVNALIQIALALVLLVGVNVYSYFHYVRIDVTSDERFTLPKHIADQFAQLKDKTTVVVFLPHKSEFADNPKALDDAAEKKTVEKAQDLVAQFREFGSQFDVVILDSREMSEFATRSASFTLTEKSLTALAAAGVNKTVLKKLEGVKGREFANEDDLSDELKQVLTKEEQQRFERQIVQQAANSETGKLTLTEKSLAALATADVNEAVLKKLEGVKDKRFASRDVFADNLRQILTKEEQQRFERLVLHHAEKFDKYAHAKRTQSYQDRLEQLPKEVREAIRSYEASKAAENSVFFFPTESKPGDQVQRISFNDFYRLDRDKSKQDRNLVLQSQGIEPFSNKELNIDEKKPRVGILVIHEVLTTRGQEDELSLKGLRNTLTKNGFEVTDIILKKWSEFAPPEPAVYTFDESRFERLEAQLTELEAAVKALEEELKRDQQVLKDWESATLADLSKKYARQLRGAKVTEEDRRVNLPRIRFVVSIDQLNLSQAREERDDVAKEKASLNFDAAAQQRRMTDLKAKLTAQIDDCDLLLIPRMTLRNVTIGDRIPNRLYRLDEAQVSAIKDYLKNKHKPILACFGPGNEPADRRDMEGPAGPDELEELFEKIGIKFGKQTVLFNAESKSFADRRTGLFSATPVEIPPVEFDWKPGAGQLLVGSDAVANSPSRKNPVRESMLALGRSLDIRLRHPRPIYYEPAKGKELPYDPVFMMTSAASWNDDQPFPTRERTPRREIKQDDPARGTVDEKRGGPFPIAVAVETALPADWYPKDVKPGTVRIAAIGHGGLFVGGELSPAKEKLLLNTCNWLLGGGRDKLLPRIDPTPWKYPRVLVAEGTWPTHVIAQLASAHTLSPAQPPMASVAHSTAALTGGDLEETRVAKRTAREYRFWQWVVPLAPPVFFAFLGLGVLLVRWLR